VSAFQANNAAFASADDAALNAAARLHLCKQKSYAPHVQTRWEKNVCDKVT
jgi:hypothetical protein